MSHTHRCIGPARPARRGGLGPLSPETGSLSLEWVLTLPVLAAFLTLLFAAGFLVRDVLVLQEAARVGARVASVTPGTQLASEAARDAAPELDRVAVAVVPAARSTGDQVEVIVRTTATYGPISYPLSARSVARTEPVIDAGPRPNGGWTDPAGPPGAIVRGDP